MKYFTIKISLIISLLFQMGFISGQTQKGALIKGKKMMSEIAPNEVHKYQVTLEKDQFAFFKLMQKGIDLQVTTYDHEGKKMGNFDSPNGKNGPELFSIISVKKGKYVIEVSPLDDKEPTGSYELEMLILKPKATTPGTQVDQLFVAWDNNASPGAAVAVAKDGKIIFKKGYGMANLEYDIPITPATVFHIASVSKQFTVFSILLLEKQGKLSLDDDIRKYIPEVPDFGKKITLRHLASHTSGLRDQWSLLSMAGWRMDDVITKEHVLKLVSKQKDLNFAPGDEYLYCNTGFTLLAEVVSRVSNMTFAQFTKKYIFEPLNMKSTLFYDDHEKIVKNRAYSYYTDSTGIKKSVLNYANVGATSLFTTVEDLSLWAMNFSDIKVGDTTIINKMNTPATLNNGKTFGGALGQFVGMYKGLNEIQHGGADAGYRTYLTRFPDQNFSVVVFSNSAEFNSGRMAHNVVDIYLKDKLVVPPKKEDVKIDKADQGVAVDRNILKTYVGVFELQPGFNITITEESGQLSATATGQSPVPLIPISETEFAVKDVDAKIEFVQNGGENIKTIKLDQGGQIREAPRVQEFDKSGVVLSEFIGSFFSEELSTTYDFVLVDGKLMATHSRLSDFELTPVKKDIFAGAAWFFSQIEFIRDENNIITGCKASNDRARNLYFKKI